MPHTPRALAAVFAALALAPPGRPQDPIPLPLPIPQAKPERKPDTRDPRVTVLEKGPVHEGFAQPGAQVRGKGVTAPQAPPAPVDEVPPEPKPEGAGVKWLAGYWQWDAERDDFVWVCGCYRNAPPDRTWEPGRWKEVGKVWTYFPGYWRPTDVKSLRANLPEPPAAKEESVAPNDNPGAMWVPGVWEHKDGKFAWRPGYWPPSFGNLVWQQGQYVATETGFAFVPGHWDYPLEERGVLHAAVSFSRAQREKRGWAYRPEYAIAFGSESKWGRGGAFDALFIGPNYHGYFYGDYAAGNGQAGQAGGSDDYQPWDAVAPGYTNPLWQHYVRLNRADSGLAKDTTAPDVVRTNGGKNPLAFVEPGACVGANCGPGVGGVRSTVGYQYVSPRGSITTGTASFRWSAPAYPGRHR